MEDITFDWKSLRKGARQAALALAIAGMINAVLVNPITHALTTDPSDSYKLAGAGLMIFILTCFEFKRRRKR